MTGYNVFLSGMELTYLINLVEQDLEGLRILEEDPSWIRDRIREVRARRDYLQSIYNTNPFTTGGDAK